MEGAVRQAGGQAVRWRLPCGGVLILLALTGASSANVLYVGPGEKYPLPSQAINAAAPGDTIRIAAGSYRDCAAWSTDNLTVEGTGAGPVISGAACQGKGIFVVDAQNATIRNITFEGAETDEGNGSGIRAEGTNITVEDCTFRNNQDGILTANRKGAIVLIRRSTFDGNGACLPNEGCAHGVYIGFVALARIEHSHFIATKVGHHVKSRARRTELIDNTIEDGPRGTSSYLVDLPTGGSLLMTGNTLQKGPNTENPSAAVSIGEEGAKRPPGEITVSGNTFINNGPRTVFVRNLTKTPARLNGNIIKGPVQTLAGPGSID